MKILVGMGHQKTQNFMPISNISKCSEKKDCKKCKIQKTQFTLFFTFNFFSTLFWAHFKKFGIGTYHTNFDEENKLGQVSSFCKFYMHKLKKRYIFRQYARLKNLLFCQ
jgi:hypothetical protein